MLTKTRTQTNIMHSIRLLYQLPPSSWKKAAGLLRRKRAGLERHLQKVRREWNRGPARV